MMWWLVILALWALSGFLWLANLSNYMRPAPQHRPGLEVASLIVLLVAIVVTAWRAYEFVSHFLGWP